jgi:glycerol-3-phosphate cytidylyltransferase
MVHGVFDLFHAGHLWHLKRAKEHCERLVVSLVADAFISKRGRPIVPQGERMVILLALRVVDNVLLTKDETPIHNIGLVHPNVWMRGEEYRGVPKPEDKVLSELGIPSIYLPSLPITTTSLIERIRA